MSEQYQCRFCPQSYKEVLEFLDHFETHMKQDQVETKQNDPIVSSNSINDEKTQKEQMQGENEDMKNDICDEHSKRPINLGNKKFHQCKTCNKKFKLEIQLKIHLKKTSMAKSEKKSIWKLKQLAKKKQNHTNATLAIKALEKGKI